MCQSLLYSKVTWFYTYICSFFFNIVFHYDSSQDINCSSLCNTVGSCCLSILNVIVYICQLQQRRQWQPTPVLLPGKSHGRRSLVGCSQTRLSDFTFIFPFHFHALEKEMATQSSVLAWRIPGTGEPGGLPSMVLHRVGHD